jgi:hypothetical protein
MTTTIGHLVLERNQAGGPLTVPDFAEIARDREEADQQKQHYETSAIQAGRHDRYVIATLEVADDDRD